VQDLFKYKGYSIFCYCEPSEHAGKYKVNVLIQDVEHQQSAKHTMKLDGEFSDIQVALEYAGEEGRQYIDNNDSGLNSDLKYRDMKKNIE